MVQKTEGILPDRWILAEGAGSTTTESPEELGVLIFAGSDESAAWSNYIDTEDLL